MTDRLDLRANLTNRRRHIPPLGDVLFGIMAIPIFLVVLAVWAVWITVTAPYDRWINPGRLR
jgi:hypothetical protein